MPRTIHKTDKPVALEGFQAVVAPSKFGYSLGAIVGSDIIERTLEDHANVHVWILFAYIFDLPSVLAIPVSFTFQDNSVR